MKIGLDLRLLQSGDSYSTFIALLLQKLISTDANNSYCLYLSAKTHANFPDSVRVELISAEPGSFSEQLKFSSKLRKDKNDLMIFFNEKKPLRYKGAYYLFVKDMKETHYHSEDMGVSKMIKNLFLNTGLEKAQKIICFEKQTRHDINEQLNIPEDKLEIIYPFFTKGIISEDAPIGDIKLKYSIKGDFLIYSSGNGNNKNLSKLIEVFKKLALRKRHIKLVILDRDVCEDLEIRKEVVNLEVTDSVFFVGETSAGEKKAFYEAAKGTIFPSLYESFPFSLTEAITYDSPILASNINQIQEIMGDTIAYFSPVSIIDMVEAIENFITVEKKSGNYLEIFAKYNPESSAKQLLNIIHS